VPWVTVYNLKKDSVPSPTISLLKDYMDAAHSIESMIRKCWALGYYHCVFGAYFHGPHTPQVAAVALKHVEFAGIVCIGESVFVCYKGKFIKMDTFVGVEPEESTSL
jgi:hypothetical protein